MCGLSLQNNSALPWEGKLLVLRCCLRAQWHSAYPPLAIIAQCGRRVDGEVCRTWRTPARRGSPALGGDGPKRLRTRLRREKCANRRMAHRWTSFCAGRRRARRCGYAWLRTCWSGRSPSGNSRAGLSGVRDTPFLANATSLVIDSVAAAAPGGRAMRISGSRSRPVLCDTRGRRCSGGC